jgi:hypothetical protein
LTRDVEDDEATVLDPAGSKAHVVLMQCPKGHPIGRAVEDGLWMRDREEGYFWRPDLEAAHLGRILAWCDTCKVHGYISVGDAMRAVRRRDAKLRLRMSNQQP